MSRRSRPVFDDVLAIDLAGTEPERIVHVLFLSYSRDERVVADRLNADLTRFGHEVWLDERLEGGVEWWEEILERIRTCSAFICVITGASTASRPCRVELDYALALDRGVLPVSLKTDVDDILPSQLIDRQVVVYSDGSKDEVANLIRALAQLTTDRPLPDPLPPLPPLPSSRFSALRDELSSDRLDADQQAATLRRIRIWWDDESDIGRTQFLLNELRHRPDLFASIVGEIDVFAAELLKADATPTRRRMLARWKRIERTDRVGAAFGALSVVAIALGQISSELYLACDGCERLEWGEEGSAESIAQWPYLVLGVGAFAGLVALGIGRFARGVGVGFVVIGLAMFATVWIGLGIALGGSEGIQAFGPGFLWSWLAGLLALLAGTVMVTGRFASFGPGQGRVARWMHR